MWWRVCYFCLDSIASWHIKLSRVNEIAVTDYFSKYIRWIHTLDEYIYNMFIFLLKTCLNLCIYVCRNYVWHVSLLLISIAYNFGWNFLPRDIVYYLWWSYLSEHWTIYTNNIKLKMLVAHSNLRNWFNLKKIILCRTVHFSRKSYITSC